MLWSAGVLVFCASLGALVLAGCGLLAGLDAVLEMGMTCKGIEQR